MYDKNRYNYMINKSFKKLLMYMSIDFWAKQNFPKYADTQVAIQFYYFKR